MHPPGNRGSPTPTHTLCDLAPSPSSLGISNDSRAAPANNEDLITSATWLDLATVGLVGGSVIVDEDIGIRPAAEMSPRHTVGRTGSDLMKPRSGSPC